MPGQFCQVGLALWSEGPRRSFGEIPSQPVHEEQTELYESCFCSELGTLQKKLQVVQATLYARVVFLDSLLISSTGN